MPVCLRQKEEGKTWPEKVKEPVWGLGGWAWAGPAGKSQHDQFPSLLHRMQPGVTLEEARETRAPGAPVSVPGRQGSASHATTTTTWGSGSAVPGRAISGGSPGRRGEQAGGVEGEEARVAPTNRGGLRRHDGSRVGVPFPGAPSWRRVIGSLESCACIITTTTSPSSNPSFQIQVLAPLAHLSQTSQEDLEMLSRK